MPNQLRYLTIAKLYKMTKAKRLNGTESTVYTLIGTYNVQTEEITDAVSTSIYGARINNMLRLTSIRNELENYLKDKMNLTSDNISLYTIEINSNKFRIASVKEGSLDIEIQ